jgi:hypothetical protein
MINMYETVVFLFQLLLGYYKADFIHTVYVIITNA